MKILKSFIILAVCCLCFPLSAQVSSFDDLTFEEDSTSKAYKPTGKKFAFIKSKRGSGGVNKTTKADSILTMPISEIVLVYSELNSSAISNREEANRERWENLLKTYPELFQFSTSYKNLLQYNKNSDTAAMKLAQGFYVYYGSETKEPETKAVVETPKPKDKKETKSEPVKETKSKKEKKEEPVAKEKPVKEKREKKQKEETKKEEPKKEEEIVNKEPEVEVPAKTFTKKVGYTKPKKAKNPKACRQPCYEGGDEGLNAFLKENVVLSKKQKKHSKGLISNVKLQLNFDGSIKKYFVTGEDEELNKLVTTAINNMDLWQPAVKNGITVKSEVKMVLIYDKSSKGMKAT
ncbi:MAG: hypothetical protein H0W61_13205 [Bacteroidetes bacterium]|nr:hypothetical protein [Bacteroidota bacterium]